jgi:aryl-alcohol dehydrogenase-like predicted oxidoreductase
MKYRKLGPTGLDVSPICLGCMSFGIPGREPHAWAIDEETSRPIMKFAVEAGINFFDTANIYSQGVSEEIVGRFLREFTRRDEVVIATKVWGRMRPGPNGAGLSRKAIMQAIDESLRRLRTDYVDLYQIHRFDPETPVEETLEALHDLVKVGKVRYIGASTMYAWQFGKMLHVAAINGWTRFSTMQNYLNLLYREEEREMLPLCAAEGVGVLPWSPLARGRLTRLWDAETERSKRDRYVRALFDSSADADRKVVQQVAAVAESRQATMAQVSLAWLLAKPQVSAPIVGATKVEHLADAIGAIEFQLSEGEVSLLEAPYEAHGVAGFQ